MRSVSLSLFLFLGSIILFTLPYQNYYLGETNEVNLGFWAKYRYEIYSELGNRDPPGQNFSTKGIYIVEFEILSFSGTNITLRESLRHENGSIIKSGVISGDPYYPIYSKYSDEGFLEHDINIFMTLPGLKTGDFIPDPVWVIDKNDFTHVYPWSQSVNSTTTWTFDEFSRRASNIKWNITTKGLKNSGPFMVYNERNSYYDVQTGVMLSWHNISKKIYYDWANNPSLSYYYIHNYTMIDSSLHK